MSDTISQLISAFSINSAIDILIMAFIIYKVLGFIKESRAEQLVKGIILIVVAAFIAGAFDLFTVNWILSEAMTIGILALIVLFQPELRRGLSNVGNNKLVTSTFKTLGEAEENLLRTELVKAIDDLSKEKTGALIVVEKEIALEDIANSGTALNAKVSSQLLENLFYSGSPLHDGAVIIRGDRILCAGCVLPLTENTSIPKYLGTRHRAAIGMSENSDAISLVVSEETGTISVAQNGELKRFSNSNAIDIILKEVYQSEENTLKSKIEEFLGSFSLKNNKKDVVKSKNIEDNKEDTKDNNEEEDNVSK